MKLNIGLNGPTDLLEKAIREKDRAIEVSKTLDSLAFSDHVFNFAVTIHHISDWAKKIEPTLASKEEINTLIKRHNVLQACRDICNSIKHFKITRYTPTTKNVQSYSFSAAGLIHAGKNVKVAGKIIANETDAKKEYELDSQILIITMSTNETYSLDEFCENAITAWDDFFKLYGYHA